MKNLNKEKDFEEAIIMYGGIITKVCYYFSSDHEEFKDLRQEVFCNIWKGWDLYRKDAKLSTWIYRVAFNTCVSYQRKEKRNKTALSLEDILHVPYDENSSRLEKYNSMNILIKRLNYRDRAIILMWLDDKTYEEISELTGITRNTIAVRLKRIKEKLAKMAQNI